MGAVTSLFSGKKEVRVLMLGLSAAGKTTIIGKLKLGEVETTVPTIGFTVKTVRYKRVRFILWDLGGQDRLRPLWKPYYQGTLAVIFVVDSNDRERIGEAAGELQKLLSENALQDSALLVLANKQDLPNAMSAAQVTDKLGLHSMKDRKWSVHATCAGNGEGLFEGLDWLASTLDV